MPIFAIDQIESVDKECGKIEGVGYVFETEVLCQSFDKCLMRLTKEQSVVGSDFGQRKGIRLRVVVKVNKEVVDVAGMRLVMEVCLWIICDCLATSRNLDPRVEERLAL